MGYTEKIIPVFKIGFDENKPPKIKLLVNEDWYDVKGQFVLV